MSVLGLNVLIIDDDEDFSEGLTLLLRRKKHNPITAHTAIEGLKIAKEQNPEAILLDLLLPGMDGVIALELFRHDIPNIPVLVISGLEKDNPKAQLAINSGIKGYIKKPFDPKELYDKLDEVEQSKHKKLAIQSNIAIIGLSGAGKSSLINRFIHNNYNPGPSTLGIDLEYYYGNEGTFRLIDLAGQKGFRDFLWKENIKIANAIVFVFDLSSDSSSYQEAIKWFWKSVNDWASNDAPILFIGNKSDLKGLNIFEIYRLFDLTKLSNTKHNFQVIQTSAKTGENVALAFGWLLENFGRSKSQDRCINSLILIEKKSQEVISSYNYNQNQSKIKLTDLISVFNNENIFSLPDMQHTAFYHQDKYLIVLSHSDYLLTAIGECDIFPSLLDELQNIFNYLVHSLIFIDTEAKRNELFSWLLHSEFKLLLHEENILELKEDDLYIIIAEWNHNSGGKLHNIYPKNSNFNPKNIISTCFMTKFGIFGFEEEIKPTILSIPIAYEKPGYEARILFDKEKDDEKRIYAIITLFKELELNIYEHNKYLIDYHSKMGAIKDWNDEKIALFYENLKENAIKSEI
ncbi:MAG: DNA-binding response regulator MtrA [Candidatus Heimdallarchaeota archaeon LC_3]|nr:MAG: DNA-binding response regulator MtrA [Candidatus Heimdallarchaeota archaeon LC_3]